MKSSLSTSDFEMNRRRIITVLASQLEADLILGAKWLPMAPLSPKVSKQSKAPARTGAPKTGSKTPASNPEYGLEDNGGEHKKKMADGAHPTRSKAPANPPTESVPSRPSEHDDAETRDRKEKLAEIARTVARCTRCGLHPLRKKVVPGQGNPNARIVFVGEAPGESEDEQGLAFVGKAGKLLTNIIEAMGLSRDDVYICNILKCRPPGNRDPQSEEIVACIDYLYQQLDIIQPEIIVALGAHAARTLLGSPAPIGQLRGRVHQYQPHPLAKPIRLIATYHPAYLLRSYNYENRQRIWSDMQMVLKELGLPIPKMKSDRN
jgi:uracil-DNA glycosylase